MRIQLQVTSTYLYCLHFLLVMDNKLSKDKNFELCLDLVRNKETNCIEHRRTADALRYVLPPIKNW